MTTEQTLKPPKNRSLIIALVVGVAALAAGIAGALTGSLDRFFQSYLMAYMFWLGLSLGGLGFLMTHFLTGSRWGLTVRRIGEAASTTLWLMAALFIPIIFNLRGFYVWARPDAVQASAELQQKSLYLNVPFFIIRVVIYFAIWIIYAMVINRLSARWGKTGDPAVKGRLVGLGASGLIVYGITMTFAAIDWMLSLEPFWHSTIFGLVIIFGQLLSAIAFMILVINFVPSLGLGRDWTYKTTPVPYQDLGALTLAFLMGWAYLAYFQLLIIWAGNLPNEVSWYVNRTTGGWLAVGIIVTVLQFCLPFIGLIWIKIRHNLRILAVVSASIFITSLINVYWEVIPAFYPGKFSLSWLDIVLPIGMGGLWIALFLFVLQRRPALREEELAAIKPAEKEEQPAS